MQNNFKKNLKFTAQGLPKTKSIIIWLIGILRVRVEEYITHNSRVLANVQQLYVQVNIFPLSRERIYSKC